MSQNQSRGRYTLYMDTAKRSSDTLLYTCSMGSGDEGGTVQATTSSNHSNGAVPPQTFGMCSVQNMYRVRPDFANHMNCRRT